MTIELRKAIGELQELLNQALIVLDASAIENVGWLKDRMRAATVPFTQRVSSDFSYCLSCEELSKELVAAKARPVPDIKRGELRSLWINRKTGWDFYVEVDAKLFGKGGQADQIFLEPKSTGKALCERHCEATAFEITIRELKGEIDRLKVDEKPAAGDVLALRRRIHALEGDLIGYKQMLDLAEEKLKAPKGGNSTSSVHDSA